MEETERVARQREAGKSGRAVNDGPTSARRKTEEGEEEVGGIRRASTGTETYTEYSLSGSLTGTRTHTHTHLVVSLGSFGDDG